MGGCGGKMFKRICQDICLQSPVVIVQLHSHQHFQTLHVACIPEFHILLYNYLAIY